jgi:ankyrin repeat protein
MVAVGFVCFSSSSHICCFGFASSSHFGTHDLEPSVQDNEGQTALILAVSKRKEHLVSLLLAEFCQNLLFQVVSAVDKRGNSALTLASKFGQQGIIRPFGPCL